MSRLTRDGTAEPVSRDQILRHARGQGNVHFPCSADHEQDWQPYPVDPYSAICDDHTYIHTYYYCVPRLRHWYEEFILPPQFCSPINKSKDQDVVSSVGVMLIKFGTRSYSSLFSIIPLMLYVSESVSVRIVFGVPERLISALCRDYFVEQTGNSPFHR